ncbi:MAG: hypothetical protein ACJ73S_26060 [Mycobacteriales bacterium]
MTIVLLILVCVLGAGLFVQFGALVEMYEQLKQVRRYLHLVDTPETLDLGVTAGQPPSTVGLPAELDAAANGLVLFLSNKCESCRTLAANLRGGALPEALWVVVVPVSGDAESFVEEFDLRHPRVLVDDGEQIVNRIGLDTTPVLIAVEGGTLARAQTVPTVRQLYQALPIVDKRTFVPKIPTP